MEGDVMESRGGWGGGGGGGGGGKSERLDLGNIGAQGKLSYISDMLK